MHVWHQLMLCSYLDFKFPIIREMNVSTVYPRVQSIPVSTFLDFRKLGSSPNLFSYLAPDDALGTQCGIAHWSVKFSFLSPPWEIFWDSFHVCGIFFLRGTFPRFICSFFSFDFLSSVFYFLSFFYSCFLFFPFS